MVRLRNVMVAVVLGTGVTGCGTSHFNIARISIWHCSECDDFPMPAYGPDYSMMPGTYTGAPPRDSLESNPPANSMPPSVPVSPGVQPGTSTPPPTTTAPPPPTTTPPPMTTTPPPATTTPPVPPPAAPNEGADARPPAP
jgi:hypothetical protein